MGIYLRIGIIGLGTVGKAIQKGFRGHHEIFVHDPVLGTKLTDVTDNCDVAYIAVPTPSEKNSGKCDISAVRSTLENLPDGFSAIIKSTVIPGTTQVFHDEFPHLLIACSPEFIRADSANEDFREQEILVIGTHHKELVELVSKHHLQSGIPLNGDVFHVTPTEAELVKYAKNSFYAMKVIFGNHFQRMTNTLGQDWGVIKEIITYPQKRGIVDSHLDEIYGKMGYGGSCLPKDTIAINAKFKELGLEAGLLNSIVHDNKKFSKED